MLVLAKTTGSKPCMIFPDGSEMEIKRKGNPTILEGKRILRSASRAGVHAAVLEMMSIRPEFLRTEAIQMMKPHILIITNARVDHVDEMGNTKEKIAGCFASAIPKNGVVILPEEEFYPVYRLKAEKAKAKLILVPQGSPGESVCPGEKIPGSQFMQNFRLVLAVTDFLGQDKHKAYRAAIQAAPDFGGLKAWLANGDFLPKGWFFVSAFAANDPETTHDVLTKLEDRGFFRGKKKIGLLSLRKDRGGRTMQWFHALHESGTDVFDRLVFVGEHALALKAKLTGRIKPEITAYKGKNPEELIKHIAALEKEEAVIFGMGNMGGVGSSLVDFWEKIGIRYDL
jgi:poly-gamma-glutamate synthase PgsB/CapB